MIDPATSSAFRTIGEIATAISAIGALVTGLNNRKAIQQVHLTMNSRLDALLEAEKKVSFSAGAESKSVALAAAEKQVNFSEGVESTKSEH